MKRIDIALILGIVLAIATTNLNSFNENLKGMQDSVLRLHILANSDSTEDQNLKLKVRDNILEFAPELFSDTDSIDEVESIAKARLCEIEQSAKSVIEESGYDYSVNCELVNMDFEAREYGEITMPSGKYDALRVTIGEAEGQNWWCVMYPPMCVPPASHIEDEPLEDVEEVADEEEIAVDEEVQEEFFSSEEKDILENPEEYEIRFAIVEIYDAIKDFLGSK